MGSTPFTDIYLQDTEFVYLQDTEFVPKEGARVWISDGDLEEMGTLSFRERGKYKYWVVLTDKGSTKSVPKDAWYHHDNLEKK